MSYFEVAYSEILANRKDKFRRVYQRSDETHEFNIGGIKPHYYSTSPIIYDFELLANITIAWPNRNPHRYSQVNLGGWLRNAGNRTGVEFGEEYFKEVEKELGEIVARAFYLQGNRSGMLRITLTGL